VARDEIYLNIDAAHRGLGTMHSVPDTAEACRLLAREYRFTYSLRAMPGA
jgi:beta-galactosidase